jgi:hypothetical protein
MSYITTDGQSASLSWNKAPIWGLRPDFYYCQTVAGLLIWDTLSDERTRLSFKIAAGPCQRSHSRVRVPWDSWPYFTASGSRLLFRRLVRLAGLQWRYSTPPPHGVNQCQYNYRYINTWDKAMSEGDIRKICNKNCDKACPYLKLRLNGRWTFCAPNLPNKPSP